MTTKTKDICSECGEDRNTLREMLQSPLAWEFWPNPKYGGTWFRSENYIKAAIHVKNCKECRSVFGERT